jgi:hypothetical protein
LLDDERDSIKKELGNSPFLNLLKLNRVEENIKEGDFDQAKQILGSLEISKEEEGLKIYENNMTALLFAFTRDKNLFKQVDESVLPQYPYNYDLLWEASKAIEEESKSNANELMERLGRENSFFESGIIYSANYFLDQNQLDKSYEILVEASRLNSNSTEILKAYTLQALRMNLKSYASDSYNELSSLLGSEEWEEFSKKYESLLGEMEQMPW